MAKNKQIYFLFCEGCGHHVDTSKLSVSNIDEVRSNLRKYKCSECGSKNIIIKEKPKAKKIFVYVATEMTTERVFHKSTCGLMRNVSAENEIRFKNKENAIKRGFKPCASCRP